MLKKDFFTKYFDVVIKKGDCVLHYIVKNTTKDMSENGFKPFF